MIKRYLRAIVEAARGHADYWEWPRNQVDEEVNVARTLYNFVVHSDEQTLGDLAIGSDPPDVLLQTHAGRRIAIEVTELVDSRSIKIVKRREPERWRAWTVSELTGALKERVETKDAKLGRVAAEYDELWLAIYTDEPFVTEELAHAAATNLDISVKNICRAYLMLSYHPLTSEAEYPDKCAVFRLL